MTSRILPGAATGGPAVSWGMPRADVSLDALAANLALLRAPLPPATAVLAAVKADAYGHGMLPVARRLAAEGVGWFGLATPEEALELVGAGVPGRALLFSPAFARLPELAEAGVRLTVADEASLAALAGADLPVPARVHLKADTGMGRLGLPPAEARALARRIDRTPGLELEGVWTHFACADEPERERTERQLAAFEELLAGLETDGLRPPLAHAANSAGTIAFPEAAFDLVRPGIALYGYAPGPGARRAGLRPAMTVSAPVTFVKEVRPGRTVSYGATWSPARPTRVATVRYGYADGYPRGLSNRGWAVRGGRRLPVVGRVCMDQLLLDVGDAELEPGDRVTLLGPDGPRADELAALVGTISYELLTAVGRRVPRCYG